MLPLKWVTREAATQRRPAQREQKNSVFSAKRQAVWFEMRKNALLERFTFESVKRLLYEVGVQQISVKMFISTLMLTLKQTQAQNRKVIKDVTNLLLFLCIGITSIFVNGCESAAQSQLRHACSIEQFSTKKRKKQRMSIYRMFL